jgi:putative toxin-antitoxin system antitoxin component (TIGR02293 family)
MAKATVARHSRRAAPKVVATARAAKSAGGEIPAVAAARGPRQLRASRLKVVSAAKGAVTPKALREMAHWDATRQVAQVRQGIPSAALPALAEMVGLPLPELGRVVGIPGRTLHRRLDGPVLKSDESDRVLRVVKLLDHVADVLGSEQSARAWLREPNMALGRATPLSLMDTEAGAAEVRRLIGRLDHGVYS